MIKELTQKQKEMTTVYRDLGIKIGFSTHDESTFDLDKIFELTNKHRVLCGIAPAKNMFYADSPHAAYKVIKDKGATLSSALYGNLDINWLNYYNFYMVELGLVKETEKIVHLLELTKYVGWMWMSGDCTVITKKPIEINTYIGDLGFTDVEGKESTFKSPILHNLNGPSIVYADGVELYHLWNTRIPEELSWVVKDIELDIKRVMRIENTDIRALALKKMGIEKAFDKVDKEVLSTKTFEVGGKYELYSVDFGGDEREIYLKMVCPSKGTTHIEGVDPSCKTVDQALGYSMYEDNWESPDYVYTEPLVQS
jgi:hypothetical protein